MDAQNFLKLFILEYIMLKSNNLFPHDAAA